VKRRMVVEVMTTHELSQRRACGLIGITRRGFQRAPAEDRNRGLRQRLRELAEERRRWGCPMLYLMLRREGWRANHKRVERLYREEGLSLRRRRRGKRLSHLRVARERAVVANQTWAVDFIHDSLISGRQFPSVRRDRSVEPRKPRHRSRRVADWRARNQGAGATAYHAWAAAGDSGR
jgi:putative transposase